MKAEIEIPGEMPTLNQIIEASKSHYQAYRRMKEEHTEKVAWCAKQAPKMEKVCLHITWYRRDKRADPDNIMAGAKFVLDGLVAGGVIADDNWKHVDSIFHDLKVDKERPRVVVEIEELEGGEA